MQTEIYMYQYTHSCSYKLYTNIKTEIYMYQYTHSCSYKLYTYINTHIQINHVPK
jgi:hypothetical protein